MAAISSLRNLGPATEAALRKAGIQTAEQLCETGADTAYARLLEAGEKPHFIAYYVLHMALQDRPWHDCKGDEKESFRARFDEIKARHFDHGRWQMEVELDALGVGLRR